jgi:hypothetical protein
VDSFENQDSDLPDDPFMDGWPTKFHKSWCDMFVAPPARDDPCCKIENSLQLGEFPMVNRREK